MSALAQWTLQLDTYCDFTEVETWLSDGLPVDFLGATASLMIRHTPTDASPLVSISTTPSASGSIVLGGGELTGTATVANGSTAVTLTVAQTLNLGDYLRFSSDPTNLYPVLAATESSTSVTLQTPYAGTNSSSATVSVVNGLITINITRAGMMPLVGISQALYDLLVLSASSFETKVLGQQALIDQTVTH